MPADPTAAALSERLDALALALRDAGVSTERAATLLEAASEAAMHAVTLVAVLRGHTPAAVSLVEAPADEPARLAA